MQKESGSGAYIRSGRGYWKIVQKAICDISGEMRKKQDAIK